MVIISRSDASIPGSCQADNFLHTYQFEIIILKKTSKFTHWTFSVSMPSLYSRKQLNLQQSTRKQFLDKIV